MFGITQLVFDRSSMSHNVFAANHGCSIRGALRFLCSVFSRVHQAFLSWVASLITVVCKQECLTHAPLSVAPFWQGAIFVARCPSFPNLSFWQRALVTKQLVAHAGWAGDHAGWAGGHWAGPPIHHPRPHFHWPAEQRMWRPVPAAARTVGRRQHPYHNGRGDGKTESPNFAEANQPQASPAQESPWPGALRRKGDRSNWIWGIGCSKNKPCALRAALAAQRFQMQQCHFAAQRPLCCWEVAEAFGMCAFYNLGTDVAHGPHTWHKRISLTNLFSGFTRQT